MSVIHPVIAIHMANLYEVVPLHVNEKTGNECAKNLRDDVPGCDI